MAVDVLTEVVIDRPLAEVAGYAGDPGNAPSWYVNIESVNWLTLGIGERPAEESGGGSRSARPRPECCSATGGNRPGSGG